MAETQYVIVGGGLAAASAVEGIRELDKTSPITIISSERELPYHRPPLSKSFLQGKDAVEAVRVHDAAWYSDQKVRVRLGQTARSVHMGKLGVTLETGDRIHYDRLLLATGCSSRRIAAPGADTPGVFYLRTLEDCYALRRAMKPKLKLVIVGGGFVGMEVAASARHLGLDVTVLEMGPVVYRAFASPVISTFFMDVLKSQGVVVKTGKRVARFTSEGDQLSGVQTEDGEQFPADIALVGVGAEPNTGWLATSGFEIDRGGLVVNVRLEAPSKNVFAAGDIARVPDPVTKQPRRLEHWGNALAQGKLAGRNMAGANEPFTQQAAFFSDMFDITLNVLGDTDTPDGVEVRGSTETANPRFTALYTRGGRLIGAVLVNLNSEDRGAEFDALQKHIAAGTIPDAT
jgi:3-phenylpropionate/trans-cinnamate dioxygenase ferredoxin reductase subunit